MKKILISYADKNMAYSLKRIGKEAQKLNIFDEIRLYSEKDIPHYILSSPLMKHQRGGGYWAWKPALIWETIQSNNEGDIIVYVDAGCSLNKSTQWDVLFEHLKNFDTICFEYKDQMLEWEKFGQTSTLIKYWTKKQTLDFMSKYIDDASYGSKFNKIWGGAIFTKGKTNSFLKSWLDITIHHPELVIDPSEDELNKENTDLAYHKHDQSIITPLANYYIESVLILVETAETTTDGPIVASRVRTKTILDYIKLKIKNNLRNVLGKSTYNNIKQYLKSKR